MDTSLEEAPLIAKPEEEVGFFHPARKFYRFVWNATDLIWLNPVCCRYLLLFFIAMICFGSYFSYDEIENIQDRMTCDGFK